MDEFGGFLGRGERRRLKVGVLPMMTEGLPFGWGSHLVNDREWALTWGQETGFSKGGLRMEGSQRFKTLGEGSGK